MERVELARLLGGKSSAQGASRLVVVESDPQKFMAALAGALAGDAEVFLGNPDWGALERDQMDALLQSAPSSVLRPPSPASGYLMIPTGGTGGKVRFARHDAATIAAAVRGFTRHFELPQVNAVGVLPLYHVSGFMAWMRCVLTGGEYRPLDWKALEGGALPVLPDKLHGWTLSLVPTQLERLLKQERTVAWLRGFRIIFLGGAPAWPALLDRAAALRLPLSPGYGMTETAAMIAALRPAEFLAGARSSGAVLPHARVSFDEEGSILVGGDSIFRGYYPERREAGTFATQDGGWLDDRGQLHVTGRRDAVIITGGEKVNPTEVEAVLRGTGEFSEVVVLGVPDTEWGESVVAAYPTESPPNLARVETALAKLLSPAKRPKRLVPVTPWPVNAQGKVNRGEVARLVVESESSHRS
jgi:O-succinylbenzoic acid--CoA ligase